MNVLFLPPAERFLKKLKDKELKGKLKNEIELIAEDPARGSMKQGDLAGVRCCDVYHRGTNYEIAYCVVEDGHEAVVVIMAGTRENFYEALKRYWPGQRGPR